jgi:hypothetical protein
MGEPGTSAIAPTITNAIFAATGKCVGQSVARTPAVPSCRKPAGRPMNVRHASGHVAAATPRGRVTTQPAFEGFAERRH